MFLTWRNLIEAFHKTMSIIFVSHTNTNILQNTLLFVLNCHKKRQAKHIWYCRRTCPGLLGHLCPTKSVLSRANSPEWLDWPGQCVPLTGGWQVNITILPPLIPSLTTAWQLCVWVLFLKSVFFYLGLLLLCCVEMWWLSLPWDAGIATPSWCSWLL